MIFDQLLIQAVAAPVIHLGRSAITLWWWPFVFAFLKNMYILLDIILVVGIVMVLGRFKKLGREIYDAVEEAINSGKLSKGKAQRKWEEAQQLIESDSLEDKKRGVYVAEGILDDCLRSASLSGENLERRILKVPDTEINFREDIVWAYRMKVRLETEPELETDAEEVERVFYIFERTMKELDIL
ncbi:MAG: hypothetical protein WC180_02085 [Candidatus Paceibacterota bacterium]